MISTEYIEKRLNFYWQMFPVGKNLEFRQNFVHLVVWFLCEIILLLVLGDDAVDHDNTNK